VEFITMPTVLRARDFHIYTADGRRFVDLWLAGGKALLGHKPSSLVHELKNSAERGLFVAFPHPIEKKCIQALKALFPHKIFRFFANEERLHCTLKKWNCCDTVDEPVFMQKNSTVALWRPGIEDKPRLILIPIIPFPLAPAIAVLDPSLDFPDSEPIAPFLLAGTTRSMYNLIATFPTRPIFPRLNAVFTQSKWNKNGIYFYRRSCDKEQYSILFKHFLAYGFVLPPEQNIPAIIPGILSAGEEATLAKLIMFEPS
jgi:hypothetical protein